MGKIKDNIHLVYDIYMENKNYKQFLSNLIWISHKYRYDWQIREFVDEMNKLIDGDKQ